MEHLFIPYPLALSAKEKGFNEPCCAGFRPSDKGLYYLDFNTIFTNSNINTGHIMAPMYQQIVDWLRVKHQIIVEVKTYADEDDVEFNSEVFQRKTWNEKSEFVSDMKDNYYDVFNEAILEALKLI
jgi:hypothetical protein